MPYFPILANNFLREIHDEGTPASLGEPAHPEGAEATGNFYSYACASVGSNRLIGGARISQRCNLRDLENGFEERKERAPLKAAAFKIGSGKVRSHRARRVEIVRLRLCLIFPRAFDVVS
jgi:hypothetical protein